MQSDVNIALTSCRRQLGAGVTSKRYSFGERSVRGFSVGGLLQLSLTAPSERHEHILTLFHILHPLQYCISKADNTARKCAQVSKLIPAQSPQGGSQRIVGQSD
jgi:hypothetical protein